MATSTSQKWLIGCGIGCAAIVVLVVSLVTGTIIYVRGKFQPLQAASESRKEIVAAYGAPDAFVPPSNGAIAPERMEVFLSVRDSLKDTQARLDTAMANFDLERLNQRQPSFGAVLRTLNDLSNLIAPVGEYVNKRNRVLMDKRMGLGEYAYIYSIAYYSWLGHRPDEGPPILEKARQGDRVRFSGEGSNLSPESVRRQYRHAILRLLGNQLDSIKDAAQAKWRAILKEEIDRVDRDPDRVAWQDNLPTPIEDCLRPYRGRLETTYHPSANYFELMTIEEVSQFQWNGPVVSGEIESGRRTDEKGGVTYEVAAGVTAPVPIDQPVPAYSEQARKARIEGVVTIQATFRKDGSVGNLKVIRSLGYGLDESAVNTIATRWKFKPGALNGVPVDVQARIDVRFHLGTQ
jgi:TonB family protein